MSRPEELFHADDDIQGQSIKSKVDNPTAHHINVEPIMISENSSSPGFIDNYQD